MPLLIHILTKFQMPKMLLASELGRDEDDRCLMAIKMNEKFDKYYKIENLNPIFFFLHRLCWTLIIHLIYYYFSDSIQIS